MVLLLTYRHKTALKVTEINDFKHAYQHVLLLWHGLCIVLEVFSWYCL